MNSLGKNCSSSSSFCSSLSSVTTFEGMLRNPPQENMGEEGFFRNLKLEKAERYRNKFWGEVIGL